MSDKDTYNPAMPHIHHFDYGRPEPFLKLERIGSKGPASEAPSRIRERIQRKRDHSDGPDMPCAYCHGYGDICNPGNADPNVKVVDWLHQINCPRCGATGKEPNHG
jgi:hypothetical protein